MPSRCLWAWVVLAGVAVNVAALLIAPLIRPDLDVFRDSLSYYASGPWAVIQNVAFATMGITSLALGMALAQVLPPSPWATICLAMLVVAGVSGLGLVAFPMGAPGPQTVIGDAHQTAGTIGGVAQLVAALAFALALRAEPAWMRLSKLALLAVGVAIAGAIVTQLEIWWPQLGIPMGATIRVYILPLLILWGAVGLTLRQRCDDGVRQSSGAR